MTVGEPCWSLVPNGSQFSRFGHPIRLILGAELPRGRTIWNALSHGAERLASTYVSKAGAGRRLNLHRSNPLRDNPRGHGL